MKRSRVTEIRMHPFEARSPRRFSRNSGSVACICRRMMLFPPAPQPRSPMNRKRRSSQGGAGVAVAAPRVDGVGPAVVVDTDRERPPIVDIVNQRRVGTSHDLHWLTKFDEDLLRYEFDRASGRSRRRSSYSCLRT